MAATLSTLPLSLRPCALAVALACLGASLAAQAQDANTADSAGPILESIQVSGNLLGTSMAASKKNFAGARTVVQKDDIENSGAASLSDVMRRIPGVQISDNSGSAGSAIALNIGVRGLAGRYSPRSTVLLDGIPMSVAPYGQPQLSFAPVSLANVETVDVVRGGGAVRFGPQNVGGIINFKTRRVPTTPGITGDASVRYNAYSEVGHNTQASVFAGTQLDSGLGLAVLYSGIRGSDWRVGSDEKVNDFALKLRYDLSPTAEVYAKLSYYDVTSRTPGVRYEHIKTERYNHLPVDQKIELLNNKALPSLNVAYLLSNNVTLFGNYNSSFGAVQNTQLNSQSSKNPLQPELAKTAELGARWKSGQLSAEATLFNIKFDNQIQSVGSGENAVFYNVGATHHRGLETAIDYHFDQSGPLAGVNAYATYTYTKATLQDGVNAGNDVPFYSRTTDTVGAHYQLGAWGFDLSSSHQSRQFADEANTVAENAPGNLGVIPGFRTWNTQVKWKVPGQKGLELVAGVNNLADKRYFTRTSDGNLGKLVGAPRMVYLQGRLAF